jgi:hypothetical protein
VILFFDHYPGNGLVCGGIIQVAENALSLALFFCSQVRAFFFFHSVFHMSAADSVLMAPVSCCVKLLVIDSCAASSY